MKQGDVRRIALPFAVACFWAHAVLAATLPPHPASPWRRGANQTHAPPAAVPFESFPPEPATEADQPRRDAPPVVRADVFARKKPIDDTAGADNESAEAAESSRDVDARITAIEKTLAKIEAANQKVEEAESKRKEKEKRDIEEDKKREREVEAKERREARPWWEDQRWVDVSNEEWEVRFSGRVFWDQVYFPGQSKENLDFYGNAQNYTEFRSLRLSWRGKGYGVYEWRLEFDLEPERGGFDPYVAFKRGYIAMRDTPCFGYLRIGQQRELFGLEQITSRRYITFLERSTATDLFTPAFRAGIQQSNQFCCDRYLLQVGVYYGDNLERRKEFVADNQGVRLSFRNVWSPIYELDGRAVLHLGADWEYNNHPFKSFQVRPDTHEGVLFLDAGTLRLDHTNTGDVELAFIAGPLSMSSELFAAAYEDVERGVGRANAYGAYVEASYFLTGEHRGYNRKWGAFGRVYPHTNFWLVDRCGGCDAGWGAWQLAARWDYVDITQLAFDNDDRIFGTLHNFTLGVNWYWNPHARIMFNYIHAMPNARRGLGEYVRSHADVLACRIQVDW